MIAPQAERGLTLVEMLVVLAIVAIMAGATVMSIGGGAGDRDIRREATRLASMLRLASDDVRLAERPLAFAWDARGYRFVTRDPKTGAERPDAVAQLGTPHALPSGISLGVADARSPIALLGDGSGAPIAARLDQGKAHWLVDYDGIDAAAKDAP